MWLAIETASEYMGVALWQPGSNALIIKGEVLGRGMSAALHPLLQEAFKEAGISAKNLTGMVVNVGPGSFTSIRLGLAAAQGLAMPFNTPIVALDACEQMAAPFIGGGEAVTVWIKAKEGEVYVQDFAAEGQALSDMLCLTLDEAKARLTPCRLVGNGVPPGTEFGAGIVQPQHPHVRVPDMGWTVQQGPRLLQERRTDLTPLYIKPLNYRTLADVS